MDLKTAVTQLESRLDNEMKQYYGDSGRLGEAVLYSVLGGGKRIRGLLPWATSLMVEQDTPEHVFAASIALEMIHAYSLIHDDLPSMDDDDFRRGQPSNHKVYGEATAILAGDALLSDSFGFYVEKAKESLGPRQLAHAVALISQAIGSRGMVQGQSLDINWTDKKGQKINQSQLEQIHHLKTGKLFEISFKLGLIQKDPSTIEMFAPLATQFGLLFQIVDDYRDGADDFSQLGKTPGKDIEQGKSTYLTTKGKEQTLLEIKDIYEQCLGLIDQIDQKFSGDSSLLRNILQKVVSNIL